jgi:hypothetical protein
MDSLKSQAARELHEQIAFNIRLRKGKNKIELAHFPPRKQQGKDQAQAN